MHYAYITTARGVFLICGPLAFMVSKVQTYLALDPTASVHYNLIRTGGRA